MVRPDIRLLKQLGVRSGAGQQQILSFSAVDEQPVSSDVGLPIVVPRTPEGVAPVPGGKWLLADQPLEQSAELAEVLPLLAEAFRVASELGGPDWCQHPATLTSLRHRVLGLEILKDFLHIF